MVVNVREAEEQDFPAIFRLMQSDLGYPKLDEAQAHQRFMHLNRSDDWATFVAVADGEVIGFIGVMKAMALHIEGYYCQIMELAVSEKTRRSGAGSALVKRAEEWAGSHNISIIDVTSKFERLGAHAFYEANGYVKKSYKFTRS